MTGLVAARILLVVTLIVTAHIIKPFSVKNVTQHFLHSTKSFAFILPDTARNDFDHANLVAMTLSDGLFEKQPVVKPLNLDQMIASNFVAAAASNESPAEIPAMETIAMEADEQVVDRPVATALPRMVIRGDKDSSIINSENDDPAQENEEIAEVDGASGETIASIDADTPAAEVSEAPAATAQSESGVFSPAIPVILPAPRLNVACALSKIKPIRLEAIQLEPAHLMLIHQPKKSTCDQNSTRKIKLVAVAEEVKRMKADIFGHKFIISIRDEESESAEDNTGNTEARDNDEAAEDFQSESMTIPGLPDKPESCTFEP